VYAVNHYIVSQANPLALVMSNADGNPFLPEPTKNILRYSTHEWLKSGEKSTWHRLEQLRLSSKIGKTLDVILDEHPENDAKTT
jgi:hypothetical protein